MNSFKKGNLFTYFLLLAIFFSPNFISAQTCNCTYTINPGTYVQFSGSGNKGKPKVKPGDVICIQAGTYGRIRMDSIVGSATNPVIIKNCGGTVNVIAAQGAAVNVLNIQYSKHFRLTGTGQTNNLYGIKIQGGRNGIVLSELCTNFEVDHCEMYNIDFAGIMAKSDPECKKPWTYRENFTMRDVKIHHNYSHDLKDGEGFYIGNSFYNTGVRINNTSCDTTLYPHRIVNLELYNNIARRTGSEGIQVGCAINASVHDNIVDSAGIAKNPFQPNQNNGLQLGSGTGGKCYNNIITFSPANGIACTGIGDNLIFNNIIINSGQTDSTSGSGIFADEQTTHDSILGNGVKIINNTIINPKDNGLRIYMDRVKGDNIMYNNIIVKSGTAPEYIRKLTTTLKLDEKNNTYRNSIALLMFENPSKLDYRIKSNSPAKGTGFDVTSFGITYDYNNVKRVVPMDVGASNYVTALYLDDYLNEASNNRSFSVFPNPINDSSEDITFKFFLEKPAFVTIKSYNSEGKFLGEYGSKYFVSGWNELNSPKESSINQASFLMYRLFVDGKVQDSKLVVIQK